MENERHDLNPLSSDLIRQETYDLLQQLERGLTEEVDPAVLEHVAAEEFIASVRRTHPVVFLEGRIGEKHEIGLAETVDYRFGGAERDEPPFRHQFIETSFRKCLLIVAYGERLSGITAASSIKASPSGEPAELVIQMHRTWKLDRFPDGWSTKKLRQRPMKLAEQVAKQRGWKFDVMLPAGMKP